MCCICASTHMNARWVKGEEKKHLKNLQEAALRGESRHNEFNNVQCSLKHSSEPLRRCHSYQISGAEILPEPGGGEAAHMVCALDNTVTHSRCAVFLSPAAGLSFFDTPGFALGPHNIINKWACCFISPGSNKSLWAATRQKKPPKNRETLFRPY